MSKHVLRVKAGYNRVTGVEASELQRGELANATLVSDDACFPLKEAMQLCKDAARHIWDINHIDDYVQAVNRMKSKKLRKVTK